MEGSQTDLEHHDLKNNIMVSPLEFLFASFIPDFEFTKLVIFKCQWLQTKIPPKSLLSLVKEQGEEQLSRIENF